MTTASMNLTEQASALLPLPMFESLTEDEIKQLAGFLTEVSYKAGETIFYEKEPGDAMYILRAGLVRIWVHDEDVKEVTLAELQPGAFFGELAVLDGSERSATAEAIKDSTLYRLSREDFHRFLLNHPPVALNMIREMGARLRQTNQLVSQRATRNINREMDEKMTLGQRVADKIAAFGGSWPFIIIFGSFLATWILFNTFIALKRTGSFTDPNGSFDVYPFIALNLVLSMISAFQAPIIMMSQNRSGEKDRLAAENDYKVNLKSELMLEELTRRMERLQNEQMEELLSTARLTKVIEQQLAESQGEGKVKT